jgi:hypothetical protein
MTAMNEQEYQDEAKRLIGQALGVFYPEAKAVVFDQDFDLPEDTIDFLAAMNKVTNRLTSRWFGWFWRLWYRPRRVKFRGDL